MKGITAALLVTLAVAYVLTTPTHALSCSDVDLCVAPCVGYLTGTEKAPSASCCAGVKQLKVLPKDTTERRFACSCVKKAAGAISGLKDDAVANLPAACGTPLPFSISLGFNCNR
jgi:Protease inhibitor/seed storage/LTP family